jgi:cullin 3
LAATERFFSDIGQQWLTKDSCPEYIFKANLKISDEMGLAKYYLRETSWPKLLTIMEKALISNHMKTVVEMPESGLTYLLSSDRISDLTAMYNLLGRVKEGHKLMMEITKKFVEDAGNSIINNEEYEKTETNATYIPALITLYEKYFTKIHPQAFAGDKSFLTELGKAFGTFINDQKSRAPEFLSLFIDENLNKLSRGKTTEEDVEKALESSINLFRFVVERDLFEKYAYFQEFL